MRTSKEYNENLANGIITRQMLGDCLYSVNKRAKNARDKRDEYRRKMHRYGRYVYDRYDNDERCEERMENYYAQKECMLALVEPDCIHIEKQTRRKRIYDYEPAYASVADSDIVHANSYMDWEAGKEVLFVDVLVEMDKYYLFYDFGQYSFHTPISNPEEYGNLEQIRIDKLDTHGRAIEELVSTQFIKKLIALIESKKYTYVPDEA